MKKKCEKSLYQVAGELISKLGQAKNAGKYAEVNRLLHLIDSYVKSTLQCPTPHCPTCKSHNVNAAHYRCGSKGEGFLICATCGCSFRPKTRWWKRTKVWKKGGRQRAEGMDIYDPSLLQFVIRSARATIPGMRNDFELPGGVLGMPGEYYSSETLERAITFLQDLHAYSARERDPIPVPDILPVGKGRVALVWDLARYRFSLWFSPEPTTAIGCGGREKWTDLRVSGPIQRVEEGFTLWQRVRRRS